MAGPAVSKLIALARSRREELLRSGGNELGGAPQAAYRPRPSARASVPGHLKHNRYKHGWIPLDPTTHPKAFGLKPRKKTMDDALHDTHLPGTTGGTMGTGPRGWVPGDVPLEVEPFRPSRTARGELRDKSPETAEKLKMDQYLGAARRKYPAQVYGKNIEHGSDAEKAYGMAFRRADHASVAAVGAKLKPGFDSAPFIKKAADAHRQAAALAQKVGKSTNVQTFDVRKAVKTHTQKAAKYQAEYEAAVNKRTP